MRGDLRVVDEQFLREREAGRGHLGELSEMLEGLVRNVTAGRVSSLSLVTVIDGKVVGGWVLQESERAVVQDALIALSWEMGDGEGRRQAGEGGKVREELHGLRGSEGSAP